MAACAALLGRRVYYRLGQDKIYPNIFAMIAGAAGDRKTSTINIAEKLADSLLPKNAFLPTSFSPESLFDEYNDNPDKLWVVSDANIVITDWNKTSNGERVGARFLELYDCRGLSESFRRNKSKTNPGPRRSIPETSTSIVFGATFNVACFQGQEIQKGISRRFLYYVGDGHGRVIAFPETKNIGDIAINLFNGLLACFGEMKFNEEAKALWTEYQHKNRALLDSTDRLDENERTRLSTAPTHVLKTAQIFKLTRGVRETNIYTAQVSAGFRIEASAHPIRRDTLECAISHVDECLKGARFLNKIANRATIARQAEVLLAHIRKDFRNQPGDTIFLTRSQITEKYAPHPDRQGATTLEDLYSRIIPELCAQGLARLHEKRGKRETYAFKKE
jgi:hypothetical protein